jgi:hypothetical protein
MSAIRGAQSSLCLVSNRQVRAGHGPAGLPTGERSAPAKSTSAPKAAEIQETFVSLSSGRETHVARRCDRRYGLAHGRRAPPADQGRTGRDDAADAIGGAVHGRASARCRPAFNAGTCATCRRRSRHHHAAGTASGLCELRRVEGVAGGPHPLGRLAQRSCYAAEDAAERRGRSRCGERDLARAGELAHSAHRAAKHSGHHRGHRHASCGSSDLLCRVPLLFSQRSLVQLRA